MTGSQDTLLDGDRPEVRPPPGKQHRLPRDAAEAGVPIGDEATRITVEDFVTPVAKGAAERADEDVTPRRGRERQDLDTLDYVQDIMAALREPVLVLSGDLRVISANRSFYRAFQTVAEETDHRLIYELGRGQWDIPHLRLLLEAVLPENHYFDDFKVEHNFPAIGRRVMLLNARRMRPLR